MNLTLHIEHHDFPNVPWSRLQQLRRLAPTFYDGLRPSPGLAQPPMRYSERAEPLSADGALALAAVAANAARARSDAAARTRDVRDRAFGLEPSNVATLGLDHIGNDRRESCPPAAAYGDGERRAALDAVANHAARARGRAVSRERAEDNAWRRAHIKA